MKITWNKYQSKASIQTQNEYLDYQIDPDFEWVSRCSVMISRKNIFYQSVKNGKITYDSIQKIAIDQGDDYAAGCLLDYVYFKK